MKFDASVRVHRGYNGFAVESPSKQHLTFVRHQHPHLSVLQSAVAAASPVREDFRMKISPVVGPSLPPKLGPEQLFSWATAAAAASENCDAGAGGRGGSCGSDLELLLKMQRQPHGQCINKMQKQIICVDEVINTNCHASSFSCANFTSVVDTSSSAATTAAAANHSNSSSFLFSQPKLQETSQGNNPNYQLVFIPFLI